MSWTFLNPVSGHRFRYDGFFPDFQLLVEFQGYQHYSFPSVYIQDRDAFDALQERDRQKVEQVERDGRFKILVVREDEPYTDVEYLSQRLVGLGVLAAGGCTFEQLLAGNISV